MAYARFDWRGSQVYVWHGGEYIVCQLCKLSPSGLGEYDAPSIADMLAHLQQHLDAGHVVPQEAIDELKQDEGTDQEPKP